MSVARRALLALFVLAVAAGDAPAFPRVAPRTAPAPAGVTIWFEDETFEDCGLPEMLGEQGPSCKDVWHRATPRTFASMDECRAELEGPEGMNARAAEEFQCAVEAPPAVSDDDT